MSPRTDRVAVAYGLSVTEVALWSDRTLSVFERKAAQLGLPGFTNTTTEPEPCEDDDESEILPF